MDTVHIAEIKKLLGRAQMDIEIALHDLDTKILIGEINRPEMPVIKIKRKRRTKKEMGIKMDLEKNYQPERHTESLIDLPEDKSPFYGKPKKERKKKKDTETSINKGEKDE